MDPLVVEFPNLKAGYSVTSIDTPRYNCIAWAAGDTTRWWWPEPNAFWPAGAPRALTVDAFVMAYHTLGFIVCADGTVEAAFEKIAIYAFPNGTPTHAARQLPTGRWTSKLGPSLDIEHADPHAVAGRKYGTPITYMKRAM